MDFQIIQIVSGIGFVSIREHLSFLRAGEFVFLQPGTHAIWMLSESAVVRYWQVSRAYFSDRPHVVRLLHSHPFFKEGKILRNLPEGQIATLEMLLLLVWKESMGGDDDSKDAISIHLQMLLLLAGRADRGRG